MMTDDTQYRGRSRLCCVLHLRRLHRSGRWFSRYSLHCVAECHWYRRYTNTHTQTNSYMHSYTQRTLICTLIFNKGKSPQHFIVPRFHLQCFDAVGWVSGKASSRKNLTDEVLAWFFWSEVQIACIWFSWCHCHPIISASAKSRMVYPSGTDSPG